MKGEQLPVTRKEFLQILSGRGVDGLQAELLTEQILLLSGMRFREVLPELVMVREGEGWRIATSFGSPLSAEEADEIIRRCKLEARES